MLAIHDNPKVMKPYYDNITDKKKQEEFLYKWMTEELGMTASFPENAALSDNEPHPSKILYDDISSTSDKDFVCCLQKLQYHKCSAFCMRKRHVLYVHISIRTTIINFKFYFLTCLCFVSTVRKQKQKSPKGGKYAEVELE